MKFINTVKKSALLSLLFLTLGGLTDMYAQKTDCPKEERFEKIKVQKTGYLVQKLGLTPEQSQDFWPVYNQMEKERFDLRHKNCIENKKSYKKIEELTETEAEKLIDEQLMEAQKLLDLRKTYSAKFKQILPAKKVLLLFRSEREFQRTLFNKIQESKKE